MLAIEHDPSGLIYESSRAGKTQGSAYSALFPDSEHVIDANSIKNVSVLSPEQVSRLADHQKFFQSQVVNGAYKNTFKDRDPDLVSANMEEARNLRAPKQSLNRPFVEAPVDIGNGLYVKQGDRVKLSNGTTGVLSGYQDLSKMDPEKRASYHNNRDFYLSLNAVKGRATCEAVPHHRSKYCRQILSRCRRSERCMG